MSVPSVSARRAARNRSAVALVSLVITGLALYGGVLDEHRFELGGQYGGSGRHPSFTLSEQAARYGDWYVHYGMIARHAPQSSFLLDPNSDPGIDPSGLFALAEARSVEVASIDLVRPEEDPFVSVSRSDRTWSLWVNEPGRSATLAVSVLIHPDGRLETLLVEVPDGVIPSDADGPGPGDWLASWINSTGLKKSAREGTLYVILTLLGGLMVPRDVPIPRSSRPAIALIAGISLIGLLGVLRLPGVLALGVAFGIAVAAWRYFGQRNAGWGRLDVVPLLGFLVLIVGLVVFAHSGVSVVVSLDSFSYLIQGHELAEGRLSVGELSLKRGALLQGLYGLGFAAGVDFLTFPGAVLLVAATVLLVGLGLSHARGLVSMVAVVGLALLPWFHLQAVSLATYVNSHAILAVMLLSLALVINWMSRSEGAEKRHLLPLLIVLSAAPIVTRPEGVLLVGLLLLGASRVQGGAFPAAWRSAGMTAVLWGATLYIEASIISEAPTRLLPPFIVAGAVMFSVPWLRERLDRRWVAVPILTAVMLWVTTLALTVGPDSRARAFASAAIINLGEGRGRWGILAPVLFLLAVLSVTVRPVRIDGPGAAAMRFFLIGFIPVSLLAKLGDGAFRANRSIVDFLLSSGGGGRVGWGDSVNRMWMHAVLVIVGLAIIRFAEAAPGERPSTLEQSGVGRVTCVRDWVRALAFAVAVVWIASQWRPFYVEEVVTPDAYELTDFSEVAIAGSEVSPELADGVRIEQQILLDGSSQAGENDAFVCVEVPFVTYLRQNMGSVEVELAAGALHERYRVEAAALEDWGRERFCLAVPGGVAIPEVLEVAVEGHGARTGEAVSTLNAGRGEAARGRPVVPAVIRDGQTGVQGRLSGPLAITATVSAASLAQRTPLHPFERFERAAMLGIPMLVAVLVILLLVLGQRGRGRGSGPVTEEAARRTDLRATGTTLVVAGLLVLTLGTAPAADDRLHLAMGRQDLGVTSARAIDTLHHGQSIEQRVAPSRIPDLGRFERDLLGRQEYVCVSIGVQQPTVDEGDSDAARPEGVLEVALSLSGDREWPLVRVEAAEAVDGRLLACFEMTASQLARAEAADLQIRPAEDAPATLTGVRLQQRRSDEDAARIVDSGGVSAAEGVVDYQFVREAQSYQEIVIGRIGAASVLVGVGILTVASPIVRRRTRPN